MCECVNVAGIIYLCAHSYSVYLLKKLVSSGTPDLRGMPKWVAKSVSSVCSNRKLTHPAQEELASYTF